MNLTLQNDSFLATGIFGTLFNNDKTLLLQTLQHAYAEIPDLMSHSLNYQAKIPPGEYVCIRGIHTLEPTKINPDPQPFETFEITGVEGHSKLLFHIGNYNEDSIGCVLLGLSRQIWPDSVNKNDMILKSKDAFEKFMAAQEGCSEFSMTVS